MASRYLENHNNPLTLTHIEQNPNKNKKVVGVWIIQCLHNGKGYIS